MKRKALIGFIIFIVIIILISIIVLKNIDSKPTMSFSNNKDSIDYSEELEQARAADRAIKEQKQKERDEYMLKVLDIVERFYPNELTKILQDAKKHEEKMTSETYVAISEPECRLVELIINIIEHKDISNEEENDLKDYLDGTDFKLKEIGNTELLEKVNNILEKN